MSTSFNHATTNGHVSCFYDSETARLEFLIDYFVEGITNQELCLLATPGKTEDVIAELSAYSSFIKHAVAKKALRIFDMNSVYLPNGKFSPSEMLQKNKDFIKMAEDEGYTGLRTAGDMRWLYDSPHELEAATGYEHALNELTKENSKIIMSCLYPVRDPSGEISAAAVHCHPTVFRNTQLFQNPLYSAR